jgi:hypothetical protein
VTSSQRAALTAVLVAVQFTVPAERQADSLTAIDHMVTYCRVVDIAARRRQRLRAE